MKLTIKISESIIKRLSNAKEPCFGKLYGSFFENTYTVLGLQVDIENGINLVYSYPAEVDFCGVFQISDGTFDHKKITESVHKVDVTDNPIFIFYELGSQNKISVNLVTNDKIEKANFITVGEQDIYSEFLHIRLRGEVPLKCEASIKSVEEMFDKVRKTMSSGAIIFKIAKTNVILFGNEVEHGLVGVSGQPTVVDMCEESNEIVEDVSILKRVTKDAQNIITKEHAPLCILEKKPVQALDTIVYIDSLAMIYRHTKVAHLYEILLECVIRYLRLYEHNLINHILDTPDFAKISRLETFHFYPLECGHFLTRLYPKHKTDESLKTLRQLLHKQLLLDVVTPVFRRANRYKFKYERSNNSPLINPHEGVKPTDNGGVVALVKGKYEYYHYCQNKMDDNGWGCAYRSLQTLASWYKLQGYVDKEVPSFTDIQKCLVDIGDKPASFVGSKQWIGSTEVNFVLNTLLGITCKILYVSSGEEMGSKGPELVNHFENQGSPIMIGGGVLAHTILGVDYNQQTGSIRFLILDPHYTGGEDLHTIQSKGWCGWKTVDFWDKSAYYNMCLPQVPRDI
ncbi:probable Ufm1-specific protease 2 isoform X2 [Anoplophora glabripennis]|uniref:probable Ufm1-specific protease 2 isoform X2 n=1 Tax=Anoplophora glabripennis TaxID=217634 RepID=UPI0008749CF0|nr:probable Ufm1-specific protease 2 isoform X2 [Anoplophora glabripennis]